MARVVWVIAVAIAVLGAMAAFQLVTGYEMDPETGSYDNERTELAYLAWTMASAGVAATVLTWLSKERPLWAKAPPPTVIRVRGSPILFSLAVFLLVFAVGAMALNDALSREVFADMWMPLAGGVLLLAAGMALPGRKFLWGMDEEPGAGGEAPRTCVPGLVVMALGAVVMVSSFVAGVAVTSEYFGTPEWYARPYALYIIVGHLIGLLFVFGGLVMYAGATPFPHWRIRYRPPGVD